MPTANIHEDGGAGQPFTPPKTSDGKIDWDAYAKSRPPHDPALGIHLNWDEKRANDERLTKILEEQRKAEEARLEIEKIKAGGLFTVFDKTFGNREPRDILRRAVPPPYAWDDVPRCIGEFAWYYSQATGFDISGAIVASVTAAASVIDDAYRLSVRPESDWTVSARQWAFLCGGPSTAKSPCIRAATAPIKHMHHVLLERWRDENEALATNERTPLPALYTSDSTVPALSDVLQANPRGVLMLTEEFASWVGPIDSADRGESAKNRGDWLQLRDGGARQINRVGRGAVYVPNWGVSVLAASTPDGLAKQMKQMPEDGLIQRFIPCILATPNLDSRGDATEAMKAWSRRLESAYELTTVVFPTWVEFSPEARAMFEAEERQIRQLVISTEDLAPAYAAHLGKHPGMLAEVALTFHVLCSPEGRPPPVQLGTEAMEYAIRYMRKARRHAHCLYSSILSSAPAYELGRAIARSIAASEEPITTINRDWMTQHCLGFKKADDRLRREAVQMLEDADWLSAQTNVKAYGGWPRGYDVHPRVFELFAREGEQWRARRAAVRDIIGDTA